jgi:NAD(P)-dependent dehydrogenase (short-subunit alcohol dehydrogenase family)
VIADADRRLTVAYVTNRMALPRPGMVVRPIAAALVERVVVFLASDDSAWVAGEVIRASGGMK